MSVKETAETMAMRQWAEEEAEALMLWAQQDVEPMADVGTPERIFGKPISQMTEQEMQAAAQIFGPKFDEYMVRSEIRAAKEVL